MRVYKRTIFLAIFFISVTGASIPPEAMIHFPSVSDFPCFWKKIQTLRKIFTILPLPDKFFDFHPTKFLITFFLVIDHKFRTFLPIFEFSPYLLCFSTFPSTFPPRFAKIIISPLLLQISPVFLHSLRVFRFPPTLTMMHLCITQCTYWTPLLSYHCRQFGSRLISIINYDNILRRIREIYLEPILTFTRRLCFD